MYLKIESRASDRTSELDKVYRNLNIEENTRKLNILDLLSDIAILFEIIYSIKIKSIHEKTLDKLNINKIINEKIHKIRNEILRELINNIKDLINKYPIQHKRDIDELINALLHYMLRIIFSKQNMNIILDIVEPD